MKRRTKDQAYFFYLLWFAVAVMVFAQTSVARAELASVWALDDGTKIKATDLDNPLESGNGVFDANAPKVSIFAARNEIVSFQVILEGGAGATQNVGVSLESIGPIGNSGMTGQWDSWYVGRRIELFEEHYLNITTRSHDLAWVPGSDAEPAEMTGWIPDALIPLEARTLTVPAQRNQGVWIDIFVPSETPAGIYNGTLTVKIDGQACSLPTCQLPVELQVLNATLPDTPTAKTMLFFSGGDGDRDLMYSRYSDDPWGDDFALAESMRMRHWKLGRRHRITMFIGEKDAPDTYLQGRIEGTSFSSSAGYYGPGMGVGQGMYSIHTYGGTLTPQEANTWKNWFDIHGPGVEYFLYTMDEPDSGDFDTINAIASEAKPVPSFVTHEPADGLDVDIYCAGAGHYFIAQAQQATAQGKRVWTYNGRRPFTGSFVTDDVAVATRVNSWIQHKYGIPRWFYWESTYYNDAQGGRGQINVFEDPINFSNSWGDEMNGDGLLIYPGRDFLFPAEDRGLDVPLPSIRLKNWRRGIQDVEYLVLASQLGQEDLVDDVINTLVPRALDEGGLSEGEAVPWEENGEVWLAQRRRLADLFVDGTDTDGGDGEPAHDGGDGGEVDAADGGDGSDMIDGGDSKESGDEIDGSEGADDQGTADGATGDDRQQASKGDSVKIEGSCGCKHRSGSDLAGLLALLALLAFFRLHARSLISPDFLCQR